MRSDARQVVFVAALLTLIGAGLMLWGMSESRRLTGDLIGYPLPNAVAGATGIGILATLLGVLLLVAVATLRMAESPVIRRALHWQVLPEKSLAAQVGRSVLRAQRAWDVGIGILLIVAVAVAALQDRLVAIILAVTALVVVVIYFLARREATNDGQVV